MLSFLKNTRVVMGVEVSDKKEISTDENQKNNRNHNYIREGRNSKSKLYYICQCKLVFSEPNDALKHFTMQNGTTSYLELVRPDLLPIIAYIGKTYKVDDSSINLLALETGVPELEVRVTVLKNLSKVTNASIHIGEVTKKQAELLWYALQTKRSSTSAESGVSDIETTLPEIIEENNQKFDLGLNESQIDEQQIHDAEDFYGMDEILFDDDERNNEVEIIDQVIHHDMDQNVADNVALPGNTSSQHEVEVVYCSKLCDKEKSVQIAIKSEHGNIPYSKTYNTSGQTNFEHDDLELRYRTEVLKMTYNEQKRIFFCILHLYGRLLPRGIMSAISSIVDGRTYHLSLKWLNRYDSLEEEGMSSTSYTKDEKIRAKGIVDLVVAKSGKYFPMYKFENEVPDIQICNNIVCPDVLIAIFYKFGEKAIRFVGHKLAEHFGIPEDHIRLFAHHYGNMDAEKRNPLDFLVMAQGHETYSCLNRFHDKISLKDRLLVAALHKQHDKCLPDAVDKKLCRDLGIRQISDLNRIKTAYEVANKNGSFFPLLITDDIKERAKHYYNNVMSLRQKQKDEEPLSAGKLNSNKRERGYIKKTNRIIRSLHLQKYDIIHFFNTKTESYKKCVLTTIARRYGPNVEDKVYQAIFKLLKLDPNSASCIINQVNSRNGKDNPHRSIHRKQDMDKIYSLFEYASRECQTKQAKMSSIKPTTRDFFIQCIIGKFDGSLSKSDAENLAKHFNLSIDEIRHQQHVYETTKPHFQMQNANRCSKDVDMIFNLIFYTHERLPFRVRLLLAAMTDHTDLSDKRAFPGFYYRVARILHTTENDLAIWRKRYMRIKASKVGNPYPFFFSRGVIKEAKQIFQTGVTGRFDLHNNFNPLIDYDNSEETSEDDDSEKRDFKLHTIPTVEIDRSWTDAYVERMKSRNFSSTTQVQSIGSFTNEQHDFFSKHGVSKNKEVIVHLLHYFKDEINEEYEVIFKSLDENLEIEQADQLRAILSGLNDNLKETLALNNEQRVLLQEKLCQIESINADIAIRKWIEDCKHNKLLTGSQTLAIQKILLESSTEINSNVAAYVFGVSKTKVEELIQAGVDASDLIEFEELFEVDEKAQEFVLSYYNLMEKI